MWIKENLNPLQRMTGDCSVRAVAKALDIPWEKAHLMLSVNSYLMGDIQNSNTVIGSVLREHGFKRANIPDSCPDCYTVAEFAENNPHSRYAMRGRKRDSMGRYAREGGYSRAENDFRLELEDMMRNAPTEQERMKYQRMLDEM